MPAVAASARIVVVIQCVDCIHERVPKPTIEMNVSICRILSILHRSEAFQFSFLPVELLDEMAFFVLS